MLKIQQQIKAFLLKNMYKHPLVNSMTQNAKKIIADLFDFYFANPHLLADNFNQNISNKQQSANAVCNYIAGMTDRFAYKQQIENSINS